MHHVLRRRFNAVVITFPSPQTGRRNLQDR
jgi:hypothetical protein